MAGRVRDVASSHLTDAQVGRFVGVTHVAVRLRREAKLLKSVEVLGVTMTPVTEARKWMRERGKANRRSRKAIETDVVTNHDVPD